MIFWPLDLDLHMRLQGQLVHGQLFSISAMKHDLMRLKPDWAIQIVLLPRESGRIRKNKPLAFWEDFVFVTILYALFAALFHGYNVCDHGYPYKPMPKDIQARPGCWTQFCGKERHASHRVTLQAHKMLGKANFKCTLGLTLDTLDTWVWLKSPQEPGELVSASLLSMDALSLQEINTKSLNQIYSRISRYSHGHPGNILVILSWFVVLRFFEAGTAGICDFVHSAGFVEFVWECEATSSEVLKL